MSNREYLHERALIVTSQASVEVKEKALKALENKYFNTSSVKARQQIEDSKPDEINSID